MWKSAKGEPLLAFLISSCSLTSGLSFGGIFSIKTKEFTLLLGSFGFHVVATLHDDLPGDITDLIPS